MKMRFRDYEYEKYFVINSFCIVFFFFRFQTAGENIAITKPMVYLSSSSDEEIPLQNLVQGNQNADSVPISNEQPERKRTRKHYLKRFEEQSNRSPSFLRSNSDEEDGLSSFEEWQPTVKRIKNVSNLMKIKNYIFTYIYIFYR